MTGSKLCGITGSGSARARRLWRGGGLIRLSIGGFHLLDSHLSEYYETDEQLQEIASELANRYPDVVFYTGHCTGEHCFEVLSREKGLRIHQFHVGKMCQ